MKNFDSFISKVGIFAKSAEKKTQDIIEISQLKWKIVQLKSKIERKYEKLGSLTYLNHKNFNNSNSKLINLKIERIYGELDELCKDLKKAEKEYADIKEKPKYC